MMAASQVLQSKNSSIGSPKPSTLATKPPTSAPTTPTIVVMMMPPGSSPGRMAFASAPARRPRMIQPMMPIDFSLLLTGFSNVGRGLRDTVSRRGCGHEFHPAPRDPASFPREKAHSSGIASSPQRAAAPSASSRSVTDAPADPQSFGRQGAQPQHPGNFKTERQEKLTGEDEVRLAESVFAPGLPKAWPTFLIEKSELDHLVRVERSENPREPS